MRSSATAIRTSAATASGSRPPSSRRCAGAVRQRVELRHQVDLQAAVAAEPDVEVAQPLVDAARDGRSAGGSRGSRVRVAAASTTADATVSRLVASHAARDSRSGRIGLAGDGVEDGCRGRQRLGVAEDADVARHRGADLGAVGAVERRPRRRASSRGSTRLGHLPREVATEPGAGDDALGQAVRRQPVGAVHAGAGHLADGVQPGAAPVVPSRPAGTPPQA